MIIATLALDPFRSVATELLVSHTEPAAAHNTVAAARAAHAHASQEIPARFRRDCRGQMIILGCLHAVLSGVATEPSALTH